MNIIIMLLTIAVLFIIFYSKIRVELSFKRHNDNDILIITIIVLYGILKYKKQIPFIDLVNGKNNLPAVELKSETKYNKKEKSNIKSVLNINEFERLIDKYRSIYVKFKRYIVPFTKNMKKKINFNSIGWNTEIGVDDAAQTAIITGIIWTIKSTMISFIYNNYNLYDVFINVVPNYNNITFKTSIDCIFTTKLGDIIIVGIKTLIANIKDGGKNE